MRKLFLPLLPLVLMAAASAQSAGPTNLTGSQCLSLNVFQSAPIVITVSGSWSGILQPLSNASSKVPVTQIGIRASQTIISANGIYTTVVTAVNQFQVCAKSISGTATVTIAPPAQSTASGTITGTQCVLLDDYIPGLVQIAVSGSWSGMIQPLLYLDPVRNSTVFPVGVTQPQGRIIGNGTYTTTLTAPTVLQMCGASVSGSATVSMTSPAPPGGTNFTAGGDISGTNLAQQVVGAHFGATAFSLSSATPPSPSVPCFGYISTNILGGIACGGGGGNVPLGTAAQVPVVNPGGTAYAPQSKIVVDARDGVNGQPGVACDGVTDDTAAIQNYFNYYGSGGAGSTSSQNVQLQLPLGHCKISNQVVFEGTNSLGVRLTGVKGFNGLGTSLDWYGPNFGTMMLMLGCNGCSVEEVDYNLNESGNGGGKAQNGLWFDASNTATPATYNISAISRSGNVVTAATTAAHAVTAGRIVKVAGSTGGSTSFNGTFQVQYASDNTHISWFQTGANESGTGNTGTVANYQSTPSNNLKISHIQVSGFEAVSSTISTITGTSPTFTITTTTPHFAFPGDTVVARGSSDSTYDCAYLVGSTQAGVPSSTTLIVTILPGTSCSPSNTNSSGGTLLSGSSGVRIGHSDALTEQVSSLHFTDLFVQGDQTGGSINCLEADDGGNVKDFIFENLVFNGCRFGVTGFNSGQLSVYGYIGGLVTPDSTPQLAAVDFVNNQGQVFIQGAESEGTNYRFFVTTSSAGASNVHLDGVSFQSAAPTDDAVVISYGSLTITSSLFINNRISSSAPFIQVNNLLFGANSASIVSIGNTYTNTALGCAGPSCGYAPIKDGSGNIWHASAGSFYDGKQPNITSIGDQGTVTNVSGNATPLIPALPGLGVYEAGLQTVLVKHYTNTQLLSGGTATHTFPGNFTYTSSSTFGCTCTDQTAANACKAVPASATTVTVAGTGTDTLWLSCSGH